MKNLFAVVGFAHQALAQIQHGSVGVVYFKPDKIVMAADSRVKWVHDKRPPSNDYCKVSALGGQILFVSTGQGGFSSIAHPLVQSWENTAEARKALDRVIGQHSTARGYIREVASEWANALVDRWSQLLMQDNTRVSGLAGSNQALTVAFLGGFDGSGNLELVQVSILFEPWSLIIPLPRIESTVDPIGACPEPGFCAIGAVEIVAEFALLASERAKKEAATWANEAESRHNDIRHAIRLVDLTIQNHHGDDVGGPVDAVQLNRDGSIEWYARKRNCPEN